MEPISLRSLRSPGAGSALDRRRAVRDSVLEAHPRMGRALLAVSTAPALELDWQCHAEAGQRVARSLTKSFDEGVGMLHARRIPGSPTPVDHLVIAPSGVWIVASYAIEGKVWIERSRPAEPKLRLAGRNRTDLIDQLNRQIELVGRLVAVLAPATPVRGALCLLDVKLPRLRTAGLGGVPLVTPGSLCKRLSAPGPLDRARIDQLSRALDERLPSA